MDALLGTVAPAPRTKLTLTGNLGTALGLQLVNANAPLGLLDVALAPLVGAAAPAAAARVAAFNLVDPLALEIAGVTRGLPNTTDDELKAAVQVALNYGNAITAGRIADIAVSRVAARAAAVRVGSTVGVAVDGAVGATATAAQVAAGVGAVAPARAPVAADIDAFDVLIGRTVAVTAPAGGAAAVAAITDTDWSNIKWLAKAIAVNNIAVAARGAAAPPVEISKMNIRIIAHAIAFGNNKGLLPNAAINLQNLLNSANGTAAATSILGNPSVTDLHNTILARLEDKEVASLTNIFGRSLLSVLRETFTGKLSVYDPYTLADPVVNPDQLDFDRFLPSDVLQAVLENRQKKFFPMARVNISPSWFGLFAPGNQLRFELQRGGASLDPNMPIEMRGRGSAVYGSAIKGGDYNNWQVVGNNAFISDKLEFALQTAIKRLGDKLSNEAKVEIQNMITTLKAAETGAKESAENLKTIVKAHQANKLTVPIASNDQLKAAATEYNNRIGKVAKVEGKLGRVMLTLSAY